MEIRIFTWTERVSVVVAAVVLCLHHMTGSVRLRESFVSRKQWPRSVGKSVVRRGASIWCFVIHLPSPFPNIASRKHPRNLNKNYRVTIRNNKLHVITHFREIIFPHFSRYWRNLHSPITPGPIVVRCWRIVGFIAFDKFNYFFYRPCTCVSCVNFSRISMWKIN